MDDMRSNLHITAVKVWGNGMRWYKRVTKFSVKIFIMIFLLIIVPLSAVSFYIMDQAEKMLQEELSDKVIQNISRNESYIYDSLQQLSYFSNRFVADQELKERIASSETSQYENAVYVQKLIDRAAMENPDSIETEAKVLIIDGYGRMYSNWSLNYHDYQFLLEEAWIQELNKGDGHIQWSMFSPSYVHGEENVNYISLARRILKNTTSGEAIGTLIISISQDKFGRLMMEYSYEGDVAYLCIDDGQILMENDGEGLIGEEALELLYQDVKHLTTGKELREIQGRQYLISFYTFPSPWTFNGQSMKVFQFTDYSKIQNQLDRLTRNLGMVIAASLILVTVVAFAASRWIVKPIEILIEQMNRFSVNMEPVEGLDLERQDEIGHLNLAFVDLTRSLKGLFQRLLEEHSIKEQYQYESMRAQLNPHFLFNTLSTIRWMAIIRGADNITSSIDALASMLKYSMSREKGLVKVEDELENITEYVQIHNIRYQEYVKLDIQVEDEIRELKTLKFILQPIVENAIIHGYDKEKLQLTVLVRGEIEAGVLCLYVEDDGIGVSGEAVADFETEDKARKGSKFTGIGLHHVRGIIRATFGDEYGIQIKKGERRGTVVCFRLPVIEHEEDHDS